MITCSPLSSIYLFDSCCCSVAQSCPTLCNPMDCSTPGFPVLHHLPELAKTHVHWVCDAIQPSHPLSSPSPPTFNLSQHQGLFQWVSSSHQVAKVLELQLQDQFFQWIFMTDSFRIDWFDLLEVQATLKNLLLHHCSKAPVLWCSAFIMVQFSHPYMTVGKTIALTRWTFVGIFLVISSKALTKLYIEITFISSEISPYSVETKEYISWPLFWIGFIFKGSFSFIAKLSIKYRDVHRSTVYNSQDMEAT